MDCKEKLMNDINRSLVGLGYDVESVRRIDKSVMPKLNQYKIEPQTTELAIRDTDSERILKNYIATIITEGKSKKTAYGYYRVLERFILDVGRPVKEVTTFDIRAWLAVQEEKVALVTCENYRSYISTFFKWMFEEEVLEKNPAARIKPIKVQKQVKFPFSDIELDKLKTACETTRQRALVEFLLSSGVRVSEAAAMDIADIDWNTNKVLVREGKGNKQRTVFISDVCKSHLRAYLDEREDDLTCLFISRLGNRLSKGAIQQELKLVGEIAGVENVHPHKFRRTFATKMAKRGMAIQDIQRLMGHTNINTTMTYIHLDDTQVEFSFKKCA